MAALTRARQFEILQEVLALAEEQGSVPIDEAAAAVGITPAQLREVLDPVLYLAFHDEMRELIDRSGAFLLTDGHLSVDDGHWLRDLTTEPPDRDTTLRLLIAATTLRTLLADPAPHLDRAAQKLRAHLQVELQVPLDTPPFLDVVQQAHREGRSLRVRYLSDGADEARDRELLPWRVFAQWERWYVRARDVTETEAKFFRVDRMLAAELGDTVFDPPEDLEDIPEWFDLTAQVRTVQVRVAADALERLPAPHRVEPVGAPAPGILEVSVTVYGDRHLDHILLSLSAEAEVLGPDGMAERRRALAARLLAAYD
jgi:proteasome accessory factor C